MNNWLNNFFPRSTQLVTAAGALGGFIGYLLGERMAGISEGETSSFLILLQIAIWTSLIALALGPVILVGENAVSLRGKWHRDVVKGLVAFPVIGLISGLLAQWFFSVGLKITEDPLTHIPNTESPLFVLIRALGWMVLGLGLGAGVGAVRADLKATLRGLIGGAAGGFVGGLCFDFLANNVSSYSGGSFSRCFGLIVMGAAIAFGLRLAEQSLKTAWLLGISTGPYEGKESPLNKARVTVGRSDAADLSLYRDETVPDMLGEFVSNNGAWFWQGQPIEIDGQLQTNAPINNNSILQLGTYRFRFMNRSEQTPNLAPPPAMPNIPAATPAAPKPVAQPMGPILLRPVGHKFLPLELRGTSHSLGRALDNDLVVSEATVSSNHAHFYLERGSWNLRDVGSTNGTFVNGNQIGETAIKIRVGDKVKFGGVEFEVERL
jgi:hypothetical protein